ncbi:bacterial DNA-binding domain containing protein [Nitzschia inconspicua]|uniref:Bacterial DNA-binding domain containing protein n=1 Tax=Nitzschia inconspicua TaxID=303405 RepID=A0A9K3LAW5_9STRA|nr:bacterial DNA-binding domain containing protein [Nitzschia inconspicua]
MILPRCLTDQRKKNDVSEDAMLARVHSTLESHFKFPHIRKPQKITVHRRPKNLSYLQKTMFVQRSTVVLSRGMCTSMYQHRAVSTALPLFIINNAVGTKSVGSSHGRSIQRSNFSTTSGDSDTTTTTTTTKATTTTTITRQKIAQEIAQNHDLSVLKSQRILNTVLDTIVEAVGEQKKVTLKNFGTFEGYMSKQRFGFNPSTREPISIPAKRRIRFKASDAFKKGTN